jgi:hypothetical protein
MWRSVLLSGRCHVLGRHQLKLFSIKRFRWIHGNSHHGQQDEIIPNSINAHDENFQENHKQMEALVTDLKHQTNSIIHGNDISLVAKTTTAGFA